MLISHPAEKNAPEKPLKVHLFNVGENSRRLIKSVRLDLTITSQEKLAELACFIGMFHDFGKATTWFQDYINGNRKGDNLTHHSFVSAVVCYHAVREKFDSPIWAMAAYLIVKKHHGDLEVFNSDEAENMDIAEKQLRDILKNQAEKVEQIYSEAFSDILRLVESIDLEDFKETLENFEDDLDDYGDDLGDEQKIELFFVVNLLFSVLIDTDKKDAARLDTVFFDGNLKEPVSDVFAYIENCRKNNPEKFDKSDSLNKLRDEFLSEIVANKSIRAENHFYTITAPTGIGKTFGCLAFANKLKSMLPEGEGRIIYCLPYTSIIDQNFDEFEKIVRFAKKEKYDERPGRYLLKHHHLMFKEVKNRVRQEEYSYKDYLDDKLFVESWESAMIVTTFVQFFHTIIGYKNSFLKKFHNIVNSIIILDEVQNVNPDYYDLLRNVLDVLGKRFNIRFLLITATQPEILDSDKSGTIELVDSRKYMKDPLFNRVKLKIEKEPQYLDDFKEEFCEAFSGENCLLVMNTKKSAIGLYEYINEQMKRDYAVFCLTTYLTPFDRKEKLGCIRKALKNKEKIIVVSTQLIEAGVDVSFRNVYRDFGPLDSVVQVAGRCNRNGEYGELGGEMTLINLKDENDRCYHSIYKKILSQHVNDVIENDVYESSNFADLSEKYFGKFDFIAKSGSLLSAIYDLNYDMPMKDQMPIKDFRLIEEYQEEDVYILITKEAQEDMYRFLDLKEKLADKDMGKDEKNAILLEMEKLKGKLKEYQISLRRDEIKAYKDSLIIEGEDYYRYISYKNQKEYAYDGKIGFLVIPKKPIETTMFF
ncbi:MAG: hypothetical protein BWK80_50685 [Desulfobacteraceae bacterium IS3]|nr:MAG: hypothetical protein BWK80_50685 [Desulfobacteraceae bacterium IS3]